MSKHLYIKIIIINDFNLYNILYYAFIIFKFLYHTMLFENLFSIIYNFKMLISLNVKILYQNKNVILMYLIIYYFKRLKF